MQGNQQAGFRLLVAVCLVERLHADVQQGISPRFPFCTTDDSLEIQHKDVPHGTFFHTLASPP
ncbi:hypothetical protein [Pseudomonas sp. 18173]|uniref:hypothetical protein n=1 Tax=Pseudomonas sp. 18173 TaxID=3390055 RepID=UPI003D237E7C